MLIHNVDILTDLDLKALVCQHESREAYATLVVQQAVADRVLKFNHGILKGWENKRTGEQKIVDEGFYGATEFNYCGIQVLSPEYLKHIIHRECSLSSMSIWRRQKNILSSFSGTMADVSTWVPRRQ